MSTLTSSAFGGSKARPKAPPRRRAAPGSAPPVANAHSQEPPEDRTAAVSGQEYEFQEVSTGNDARPTLPPPSPPAVVEHSVSLPGTQQQQQQESSAAPGALREDVPGPSSTQNDARAGSSMQADNNAGQATSRIEPEAPAMGISNSPKSPNTTRKRAGYASEIASSASNKRAKRSSARSSDAVQAATEKDSSAPTAEVSNGTPAEEPAAEGAQESETLTRSTRTRRATQKKNQADAEQNAPRARPRGRAQETGSSEAQTETPQEIDDTPQETTTPAKSSNRKRGTKKKPLSKEYVRDDSDGGAQDQAASDSEDIDPEDVKIDPQSLSIYDLTFGLKTGKVSEREKKMALIDWDEVKRKRWAEADAIARGETRKEIVPDVPSPGREEVLGNEHETAEERPEPMTRASGGGLRFRIVNGTIVEDADSLTIDRAARLAEAAAQDTEVAVEEENDLTVRINRTTWINDRKRDPKERVPLWHSRSSVWSEEDTDKFYDALAMFGTDFETISRLFEGRSRRTIKLKFTREERLEPERINAALLGKKTNKIDLDEFALAIGKDINDFNKYDSLEHANEVIRESMKDKEDAMRAAVKEDEENNRQREVQRQQREKQRLEAEKKKEERARKKEARRRGDVWGAGTLAAADDDVMDD